MNSLIGQITGHEAWTSTVRKLESALPTVLQPWAPHFLVIAVVLTFSMLWRIYTTIYNLYFHPLAGFPGPREAALSQNWVYKNSETGRIEPLLEKLHDQYKSHAIRIAPNELHITDVSLYKKIYSQNDPWSKNGDFYAAFGTPHSVFVETDHGLHRERRKLLNPYFSRGGVLNVQDLILEKVEKLVVRFGKLPPGFKVNLYNAFRCLTVDIISDYASGTSLNQTETADDDFFGTYIESFEAFSDNLWHMCYRPLMRAIITSAPACIAKRLSKEGQSIVRLLEANTAALQSYRTKPDVGRPVVYAALNGCSQEEAVAEATDILAAGSDTTAYTLTVALWHIIDNRAIRDELVEALFRHIPDAKNIPDLPALEKIPILNAIAKECVRIASAVPGRLPRIVPSHAALFVDGKKVPEGTIVGMSAYTMNRSQELWGHNADEFDPSRWLTGDNAAMEQNMASFSKGRRSCIGQPLAYAEIHIVLAYLLRNFDFELAPGSALPDACDKFTAGVEKPGVLAHIKPRGK
ncbi:cytochrome P450 [Fusarium avenaceum]|nr:cytochrome P450 [Fusarium avenaceum]